MFQNPGHLSPFPRKVLRVLVLEGPSSLPPSTTGPVSSGAHLEHLRSRQICMHVKLGLQTERPAWELTFLSVPPPRDLSISVQKETVQLLLHRSLWYEGLLSVCNKA